jgi:outer membrane protein, multidrug efflux system
MIRSCFVVLLCGGILGCAVGPDYQKPAITLPKNWHETTDTAITRAFQTQWWQSFNDPLLTQLIRQAAEANLDLQQATARLRDARAQQIMAVAAAFPSVSAKSNLSRRGNNLSSFGGSGNNIAGGGFGVGNQIINILQAGFDAEWELDVFGGVRRGMEYVKATVDATLEDRRAILVSVQGEVARLYVQLRANQQFLAITQDNLASQQQTLELIKIRENAGLTSGLDVAQQEALVADTLAMLPGYDTLIKQSSHALSTLLGRQPDALGLVLDSAKPMPVAKIVLTQLPSELLRRRPDIRRSERQLAASNAEIGVAIAELYPKFNLAAFLGIQNTRISDISPLGKSWSAAASISMPIFNWGKLQANIESKKAQKQEKYLAYQATILTALKEVEDALVAYNRENQRQQTLAEAVNANKLAWQLSEERYTKGLTTFLDVLDSQRNVLTAKSKLVESQAQVSQNLVALYKALGGGWEN